MNTDMFDFPGNDQPQGAGSSQNKDASHEDVQISQPKIDRQEGPFEHSGETSGWTKAEEAEKTEQEQ
jgi:hypothetical protein